jgi:restriction endonuclease Mrr
MSRELVPIPSRDLDRARLEALPLARGRGSRRAVLPLVRKTSYLYAGTNQPIAIAGYIENRPAAAPTVKQHLAAIRMPFDFLLGELLQRISAASPLFFEKAVVSLLVAMGDGGSELDAGQAVGRSGDDGIDGIIKEQARS